MNNVVLTVLCVFIAYTHGHFYAFTRPGDKTPSIILEAEFSITIKAFKGKEQVGSFTQRSSDSEHVGVIGGVGPRSLLYLRFSNSIDWAFLFDIVSPTSVTLDRLIQFVPKIIFPGISSVDEPLEYDDPGVTDIGSPDSSHACAHESFVQYYPKDADQRDIDFTVHVTLRNFHVQAFNVENGLFSTPVHCGGDFSTPQPIPHSSVSTKATSQKPQSTESTTTGITEVPIPGSKEFFSFTIKGDSSPSIILEAAFSITIRAFKGKKQVGEFIKHSSDGEEVSVFGGGGPRSFLFLRFSHSINWAFVFNKASPTDVSLDRLIQFVPKVVFPNISDVDDPFEYDDPGITDIGSPYKSYACAHESIVEYYPKDVDPTDTNFTIHVTLRNFQAQAFNVQNGKFSQAVHCDADLATTSKTAATTTTTTTKTAATTANITENSTMTTATSPMPTTPDETTPIFAINKYIIRNNETGHVCISLSSKIEFDIKYKANVSVQDPSIKNITSHLGIPQKYTVSGVCSSKAVQESLTIFFFDDWYMTFSFARHGPSPLLNEYVSGDNSSNSNINMDYSISNITLSYTIDHYKFPFAVEKNGVRHTISVSDDDAKHLPRKKKGRGYYACKSGEDIRMGQNVNLKTSNLKFKAFNDDDDSKDEDKFKGKPAECEGNKRKGFDWPIIGYILLTFFLLLLIIIVIYLIVRKRRKRRGYKTFR